MSTGIEAAVGCTAVAGVEVACAEACFREIRQITIKNKIKSHIAPRDFTFWASCRPDYEMIRITTNLVGNFGLTVHSEEQRIVSLMPGVPLRIFFRFNDFAIAHVNDAVAVSGGCGIMRDHEHGLSEFLVGVPQHLQNNF